MKIGKLGHFSVCTDVIFGRHSSSRLGSECKNLGVTKALIVTDAVIAGMIGEALDSLKAFQIPYVIFDKAGPEPTCQDISDITAILKRNKCDCVVAAGGGSAMSAGKGVALMGVNEGNILNYKGSNKYKKAPLPCIAIPTTAGSGSEVSRKTILTDEKTHMKLAVIGFDNSPRVALLDPLLLKTVPRHQAVSSGADALTHAVEALCSRYATPLTDGIALTAIEMIMRNLCPSVLGDDLEAKGEMLFAANTANIACGNAGLGLSHALTSTLTHLMDKRDYPFVAYGDFHIVLLPLSMEFNLPVAEAKLAMMARAIGIKGDFSQRELAEKSIERVKELFTSLNTQHSLPWKSIPTDDLEEVAKLTLSLKQADSNPRRANESEIVSFIQKALDGWKMKLRCVSGESEDGPK